MRKIAVNRAAGRYQVRGEAEVRADRQTAWEVLTDYDHLAEVVPGLVSSRLVGRTGGEKVVEQQGQVGLGLFRQRFSMTLAVAEHGRRRVEARTTAGDFEHFTSSYVLLAAAPGSTRVLYEALIKPRFSLPMFIDLSLMEMAARGQFEALMGEIERRADAARESQAARPAKRTKDTAADSAPTAARHSKPRAAQDSTASARPLKARKPTVSKDPVGKTGTEQSAGVKSGADKGLAAKAAKKKPDAKNVAKKQATAEPTPTRKAAVRKTAPKQLVATKSAPASPATGTPARKRPPASRKSPAQPGTVGAAAPASTHPSAARPRRRKQT